MIIEIAIWAGLTFAVISMIVITSGREAKIVETLGKPRKKALLPGPSLKLPYPLEQVVGTVNLQQQTHQTSVSVKTKDDAFVDVPVTIQFRAQADPRQAVLAHYEFAKPKKVIESNVLNSIRTAASNMTLDELYIKKDNIQQTVMDELAAVMAEGGYEIMKVLVDEPTPDQRIVDAKNQKLAAEDLQKAATFEAEAEKIRIVGRAKADAESKKLQGQGMANMRTEMAKGSKAAIATLTEDGLTPEQAMEMFNEVNRQDSIVTAARGENNLVLMDLNNTSNSELGKVVSAAIAAKQQSDPRQTEVKDNG